MKGQALAYRKLKAVEKAVTVAVLFRSSSIFDNCTSFQDAKASTARRLI